MEYIGKHAKLYDVRRPSFGACFHGETWYMCPRCGRSFEYYDTVFERDFRKIKEYIYQDTKNGCGQVLNMK